MNISPYILLVLANFFLSLNIIVAKLLSHDVPPATLAFFKWGIPLLFCIPYAWKDIKANWQVYKDHWVLLLALGATGYCLNAVIFYEGLYHTNAINSSVINTFNPALIALIGFLMYRYRVSFIQIVGFLVSFFGVLWIIFKGNLGLISTLKVNSGDLLVIAACICWSVYTNMFRKHSGDFPQKSFFSVIILYGVILTFPFLIVENVAQGVAWVNHLSIRHILGIIFLSVFPSYLAYKLWNQALTKIEANRAAIFQNIIPVCTIIISILFLGEKLNIFQIVGGVLIFIGVMLVTNASPNAATISVDTGRKNVL